MVLLKDPGSVPANWKMLPQQNVEDGNSVISSISVVITNSATMTTSQGLERKPTGFCDRCQNGKPPRCHHCSVCKLVYFFNIRKWTTIRFTSRLLSRPKFLLSSIMLITIFFFLVGSFCLVIFVIYY